MAQIPRPLNPFLAGDPMLARLLMQQSIGAPPMPMQPPQGPLTAPPVPRQAQTNLPRLEDDMPTPVGAPTMPDASMGFGGALKGGVNNFLGSDAALAFASGLLGGGSSSQALGRGFGNAFAAKQPKASSAELALYAQAKKEGYKGTLMDFLKEKDARQAGTDYGFTPIPYQRPDGSTGYAVSNRAGQVKSLDAPEGSNGFLSPFDRKMQESSGSAAGKGLGEDQATYDSMVSKMPGLEFTIKQLDGLANKATYTATGQLIDHAMRQANMEPRESAVARAQYIAVVDNQILPLLRDTFGAQFTQKEGETLRQTLGDANKSPAEKQAVLKAFIEQKRRDVEALGRRTGRTPAGDSAAPAGWQDLGNGVRIREKQ